MQEEQSVFRMSKISGSESIDFTVNSGITNSEAKVSKLLYLLGAIINYKASGEFALEVFRDIPLIDDKVKTTELKEKNNSTELLQRVYIGKFELEVTSNSIEIKHSLDLTQLEVLTVAIRGILGGLDIIDKSDYADALDTSIKTYNLIEEKYPYFISKILLEDDELKKLTPELFTPLEEF